MLKFSKSSNAVQMNFKYLNFFYLFLIVSGQNPFSVQPTNTYGVVSRNVSLHCGLTDGSQLLWSQPYSGGGYNNIADSVNGAYDETKYALINRGNNYELVILHTELSHAGQYRCSAVISSLYSYAELIVLDSDEVSCTESSQVNGFEDNVEGETVTLECTLSYSGLWAPIQEWTWSDGIIMNPNNSTSATNIVYDNTYTTERDNTGKNWVVSTRFPPPPDGAIPADDSLNFYSRATPTFTYTYRSNAIIVYYGTDVSTMSLTPEKEVYNPGDKIICVAEGNPEPTLKWVNENNETIVQSGELEITANMVGSHSWKCWAENTIRGNTLTAAAEISFNVTIPPTTTPTPRPTESGETTNDDEPTDNLTAIVAGTTVTIVLLVIIVVILAVVSLYYRKRMRKNQPSSTSKSQELDRHEYHYISDTHRQTGSVNQGFQAAVADHPYEDVEGNAPQYPRMYSTPIVDPIPADAQAGKYENVDLPQHQVYEKLTGEQQVEENKVYASLE